jgi:hypothetical protein
MTQLSTGAANIMTQPLPEIWRECMGELHIGEEASGLGRELELCWTALLALREAGEGTPDVGLWTCGIEQTVACLKMIRETYKNLAVDPNDSGFAGRFQIHFELETLGLEESGGEFLFCDPHTVLVYGACAGLERRIGAMGQAIAHAMAAGDHPGLLREVRAWGYNVARAMEQLVVLILEQLPLDTPSRSMVPGFRCGLKDLLDWLEVLRALEQLPSDQSVQHALDALCQSEAMGVLTGQEIDQVQQYQSLSTPDLAGLRAVIEAKPMVELAILNSAA